MFMADSLKVSLIYPGISVKERYGRDIGDIGGRQAPLGLLYLSAYLKKNEYDTQVIDAEALRLTNDEVIKKLTDFSPDVIAISMTTVAYHSTVALAEQINAKFAKLPIIVGGAHVTANPKQTMKCRCFSFGILREGEETLVELLTAIFAKKTDFTAIKGIVFRDNKDQIKITEPRGYIKNIDQLPYPDREALSDIKLYRPPVGCYRENFSVSMITSRGCPYQCVFCDNNTFGRKIRWFSPEYVVREIEYILKKYGAKEISFVDDTFPANRKRFIRILEMFKEKRLRFSWTCMANVNDLDEELLKMMKATGCWQIAVGIESGDNKILKLIRKGTTVEKVKKVVETADELGIIMKGFFMLGHPGETRKSLAKTIKLGLELPLTDLTCTIVTPIMGTELYEMAVSGKYGKFDRETDCSRLNYWEPVFVPKGLSEEELYSVQRDFFKHFYLRKAIIFKQISKIKNIIVFFRMLKTVIKIMLMAPK